MRWRPKRQALIAEVDAQGGMIGAVEAGLPQRRIEHSAYQAQKRIESAEDVVVGLNRFTSNGAGVAPTRFQIDPAIEAQATETPTSLVRARRDAAAHGRALAALKSAVADDQANLFDPVLAAVEADATLGEIMRVLEARYGTFLQPRAPVSA